MFDFPLYSIFFQGQIFYKNQSVKWFLACCLHYSDFNLAEEYQKSIQLSPCFLFLKKNISDLIISKIM